jgi:hypothetical protein
MSSGYNEDSIGDLLTDRKMFSLRFPQAIMKTAAFEICG